MTAAARAAFRLFAATPASKVITHEQRAPRGKGGEPGKRVTSPENQWRGRGFGDKRRARK